MSLTSDLVKIVKDELLDYEKNRELIKELAVDFLNPDSLADVSMPNPAPPPANIPSGAYTVLTDIVARIASVHFTIKSAQTANNSKVYRWVSPRLAAIAFEGVHNSCMAVWMAAGPAVPAANPPGLRPSVERFVNWQVGLFVATIEGR